MDSNISCDDSSDGKGLIIVNDEETILQFMAVKRDFKNIKTWDYLINSEYNSYESLSRVYKICEIYKEKNSDIGERVSIYKNKGWNIYDAIIAVPGYGKEIESVLSLSRCEDIILLDKGFNEFVKSSFKHNKINKKAIKYTFNKDRLASKNFKEIRELVIPEDINIEYKELISESLKVLDDIVDNTEVILFSSSDIYDLDDKIHDKINRYLEKNYKNRDVAIKRHPRDFVRYNPDNVKVHYIPDDLAGSIVVDNAKLPETWVFPSSLLIKAKNQLRDVEVLNFTHIKDKSYQEALQAMRDHGLKLVEV